MTTELKPCPACGGPAISHEDRWDDGAGIRRYRVECREVDGCLYTRWFTDPDSPTRLWNQLPRRGDEPSPWRPDARDRFLAAVAAMEGLLSNPDFCRERSRHLLVEEASDTADLLLDELAKPKPTEQP